MVKTKDFLQSLLQNKFVDDVTYTDNGFDIKNKSKVVSVRLNNKGGALIWNKGNVDVIEINSARLDEVLHRYIVLSSVGLQDDVFFKPVEQRRGVAVFESPDKQKWIVDGASEKGIMNFYNQLKDVHADHCLMLLSGFKKYSPVAMRNITSSVESTDVEVNLLRCEVNPDDYSVYPLSQSINDVGRNIVGNYLCSSADKVDVVSFENDEKSLFKVGTVARRLSSSNYRFANKRMENNSRLVSRRILSNNAMRERFSVKDDVRLFSIYAKKADNLYLQLNSKMELNCGMLRDSVFSAEFRMTPDVENIKNILHRGGYDLQDLSSGLTFNYDDDLAYSIIKACTDIRPKREKKCLKSNVIDAVSGRRAIEQLKTYGIDDKSGAFESIKRITIE